jgi:glycine cleavage system T protein
MSDPDPRDAFLFQQDLATFDPDLEFLIDLEEERQARKLIMIASESIAPRAVREAMTSVFNNIYAEGYPSLRMTRFERDELSSFKQEMAYHRRYADRRYYKGTEMADFVEALAMKRCAEAFATPDIPADHIYANVQPLSGAAANNAVYNAFCQPGDVVMGMSLTYGGHLTHGSPVNRSGRFFKIVPYEANPATGKLDYDQIRKLALEHRPRMIIAGYSAYPWSVDWAAFRAIADEVGAIFLADIAHTAGLVAAGVFPSPIGVAHVVSFTTHKTLCGPRGACILATDPDVADSIEVGVFPGEQGGPHIHTIAAKAVCFRIAQTDRFHRLMKQIVDNAATLAEALHQQGLKLAYGGTDSHMCLIDLRSVKTPTGYPLTGEIASRILDLTGITCNKNTIYGDDNPAHPSGLRFGTTWVTQRGMGPAEMRRIADIVGRVLQNIHSFSYIGLTGLLGRGKVELDFFEEVKRQVAELEHGCTARELDVEERGYPFYEVMPAGLPQHVTPLKAEHERLGAEMTEHHGWLMPAHYGDPQKEFRASKQGVAIFDRSDTGILYVWGERAQPLLQEAITGDLRQLPLGQSVRTFLLDKEANLIDDITVLYWDRDDRWRDHYLITCNAARVERVKAWLRGLSDGYILFDQDDVFAKIQGPAVVEDCKEATASLPRVMLAVQGPQAVATLQPLISGTDRLRFRHILPASVKGAEVLLHRAGYTEEDERYELYVHPDQAAQVWQALLETGKPYHLQPAGLEARKALHNEACLPAWEKDSQPVNGVDLIRGRFAEWVCLSKPYFVGLEPILAQLEPPKERETFRWQPPEKAPAKRSTLYDQHVRMKATIVPFAGYEMPVRYSGIYEEHLAVRQGAGLFDVSHMGVFGVRGRYATAFLDTVLTNYVAALRPGQATYSYLLDPAGDVLDDLYVYCRQPDDYLVVVNAVNEDKDWAWLTAVNERRVIIDQKHPVREIEYPAELLALKDPVNGDLCKVDIALQGPAALRTLQALARDEGTRRTLARLRRNDLADAVLDGMPLVIARTGYTGERVGFEIFVHPQQAATLWWRILEVGEGFGVKPAGLGARDSTRIEAGLPLYGQELAGPQHITPAQAGFGSYVKLHKPFFIGKHGVIGRRDTERETEVCRFRMDDKGVPAIHSGDPVVDRRGRYIGLVTSCALDTNGYQLGMALIDRRYHRLGNRFGIFPLPRRAGKPEKPKEALESGDQVLMHEWATILTRFPVAREWEQKASGA